VASDKLPLHQFIESVAGQFLQAVEAVEKAHPGWEFGAATLTARVALKPGMENGQTVIYADVDEPDRLMSEVPIPLRRRSG
jgi:hypothetical protein